MTLMKLAPEAVRLRRVAKAHAAGEFSRVAYRDARRQVIEQFRPDAMAGDDTRRRGSPSSDARAARRTVDAQRTRNVGMPPSARRHWRWIMGLGLVTALVLLLIAVRVHAGVRIDPVRDRAANPASSPRLPVSAVQVRDFHPHPGIDLAEVQAEIEATMAEIRERNEVGSHGFSHSELEEVGRLLNAMGAHQTDQALTAADALDLQALIRDQKQRRGVSVVELEEVAARVQQHYRQAGYFLAVAYVPAQEVHDGVVEIAILPGVLGEIDVRGGNADMVASRFQGALGQPVTEDDISNRLYQLNQIPGFKAQAAFEPGGAVGETRLNLDVVDDRRWSARVVADNHGDAATGKERLTVMGSWLNPRGVGDLLDVGVLQTVHPSNQTYGFVHYRTPLQGDYEVGGRVATNSFTAEQGTESGGDGLLVDVLAERSLHRGRTSSLSAVVGLGQHRFSWDDFDDQAATLATASFRGHRVWDSQRIAVNGALSADVGRFGRGAFEGQDKSFWRLALAAHAWKPVNISPLPGEQKLVLRLTGQLSDSQLPSSRRLSLGGFTGARGFERSTFLADRGVVLGVDLRTPMKVGELVLFADAAYGDGRNDLIPTWGHLVDVGVGWDADLLLNLSSRLSFAVPLITDGTGELTDDGPKLFWQVRYEH